MKKNKKNKKTISEIKELILENMSDHLENLLEEVVEEKEDVMIPVAEVNINGVEFTIFIAGMDTNRMKLIESLNPN